MLVRPLFHHFLIAAFGASLAVAKEPTQRAGDDWWALQPLVRSEPKLDTDGWGVNPIDGFVLKRLEAAGLKPSPPADRRTLIRRVALDLLGLPPTPEEVYAFVTDTSPRAYERLVDRLLDSPHYGERWGRHWLDVARFGESQGFERDKLRPNAWPYRDWVIHALNEDLPYDDFVRLQLAGDVLRPDDPLAVTATGFLVAAPWDEVGKSQRSKAMKDIVRQDELEDIVGTVAQTFLGLTANCARCHDHKFDPISQMEYFRLAAAVGGVQHGERESATEGAREKLTDQLEALRSQIEEAEQRLEEIESTTRERLLRARREQPRQSVEPPEPIARWDFEGNVKDSLGTLHGTLHGAARVANGRLVLDGKDSYVSTEKLAVSLRAKTLEAWVELDGLEQRGGAVVSLQGDKGDRFDAIVYGEQERQRWMAGSEGFSRTSSFDGVPESARVRELVHIALVYEDDYTISCYRNGRLYGQPYQATELRGFGAGKSQLLFGLRHTPPGEDKMLAGTIDRVQLCDRALSPREIAASAGIAEELLTEEEIIAELPDLVRSRRQRLALDLSRLRARLRLLEGRRVYAVVPSQPEVYHRLDRGDTKQPREVAAPGGIAALVGLPADFALPPDAPEAERRVKLAQWITDKRNPLVPRVAVNRLWHHHFGVGLVDTPNDFGFNGGRPSHPGLLDWLASELLRLDWSLKGIHRTIVTSATYRQSSRFNEQAAQADAENRLLWRKTPRRLDAETIRDAMLAVSGELNPKIGGPPFRDFRTFFSNTQFYEMIDPTGYAFNRRSIYRMWVRSGRSPFLDVFDCPDPSTTAPKRAVTTTPLQALALLNDSFVLRTARKLAARIKKDAGVDTNKQLERAYLLAYSRGPSADELEVAGGFVDTHGLEAFCRVLVNANEFLYVD